jgi:hypothetical protein
VGHGRSQPARAKGVTLFYSWRTRGSVLGQNSCRVGDLGVGGLREIPHARESCMGGLLCKSSSDRVSRDGWPMLSLCICARCPGYAPDTLPKSFPFQSARLQFFKHLVYQWSSQPFSTTSSKENELHITTHDRSSITNDASQQAFADPVHVDGLHLCAPALRWRSFAHRPSTTLR